MASSLDPEPHQPPTPNAVTTDLSSDGKFGEDDLTYIGFYDPNPNDPNYQNPVPLPVGAASKFHDPQLAVVFAPDAP